MISFRFTSLLLLLLCCFSGARAENYPYRSDVLWVTVPDHADWLYQTGEEARVEVQFLKYGIPRDAELTYEIGPELMPATKSGTVGLKNGRATIRLGTLKEPGFKDCRLRVTVDGVTYKHHVKVGFSPEKLQPCVSEPADFDDFWRDAIAEARKTPLRPEITPSPQYATATTDAYLVKLHTDANHCIYGYLTLPKQANRGEANIEKWAEKIAMGMSADEARAASDVTCPISFCPPGAGVKTIKEPLRHIYYAQNGFIRFEIEIHGLHPELPEETFKDLSRAFNSGSNGYVANGLDNPQNAYLKRVYVACVRCIDFLTSLPQWDGRNVGVQGGSQGGALSIVTAALDKRVTACCANHPALSDMAASLKGRASGWPHLERNNQLLTPEKVKTLAYFDVCNFARRLTCLTRMTWGYNDDACPPTTSYTVWNLIKAPKESVITPINEHWTSEAMEREHMEWLKALSIGH